MPNESLNSAPQRKIIHVDMDMFFAAIELRERPELAGKPIAVGGSPDTRGVVATSNYIARKFGVRSAMPMVRAVAMCPQLVIIRTRFSLYREESRRIHEIFRKYATAIEPLSLDEAYLDVTASQHFHGSATLIATAIRRDIREVTGLTASAGVAPNKFLAKVASDWRKPDGLTVVRPDDVASFVATLPVKEIPGVGPKTAARLTAMGIDTCTDLQGLSEGALREKFGKWGPRLFQLSRGIDERAVQTERVRKSLSVERTFATDLPTLAACVDALADLFDDLRLRFDAAEVAERVRGWTLKLRFDDFETTTIDRSLGPDGNAEPNIAVFRELLDDAWARGRRPVRLLGLGVRLQSPTQSRRVAGQLEFWPEGW